MTSSSGRPEPSASSALRSLARYHSPKRGATVKCWGDTLRLGSDLAQSLLAVSETGVRLVVKAPLKSGQEIALELLAPGCGRAIKQFAKVAWCTPAEEGVYQVGARFQQRLQYSELQDLVTFSTHDANPISPKAESSRQKTVRS